ncbi:MAG TPA: MBL fold metallo-hydrolase [Longimicrobiales bacterium]|nr:MBL fold metallo-hydrolase [Longimicrobiales bacterium]
MKIRTFTSGVFGENAYLVRCAAGEWVAIDPGAEAEAMARELEASGEPLRAILLTHAHLDHMEGVADLVDHVPAPIHLHPADRPLYDAAPQQAAMFGHPFRAPPAPDEALAHGQELRFGDRVLEVRHAPGHSPGHVLFHDAAAGVAFVGDVVFRGSIGRTDLPGGDSRQLLASIREQVLSLPDETVLYTGHGDPTTVERERTTNPFLAPSFGGGLA